MQVQEEVVCRTPGEAEETENIPDVSRKQKERENFPGVRPAPKSRTLESQTSAVDFALSYALQLSIPQKENNRTAT